MLITNYTHIGRAGNSGLQVVANHQLPLQCSLPPLQHSHALTKLFVIHLGVTSYTGQTAAADGWQDAHHDRDKRRKHNHGTRGPGRPSLCPAVSGLPLGSTSSACWYRKVSRSVLRADGTIMAPSANKTRHNARSSNVSTVSKRYHYAVHVTYTRFMHGAVSYLYKQA